MSARLLAQSARCSVVRPQTFTAHAARRTLTTATRAATTACPMRALHAVRVGGVRRFADEAPKKEAEPAAAAAAAAPATPTAAVDPKVAELTADLAKKDAQIKDLQEKYTYALAEAQNTLTRSIKQLADAKQFAVQSFAKSLLEVADILEIATKAAEPHATASSDANFKNLFEGVGMTQKVLLATFERNGLKKFEPLGEKFDPYFQEGLMQMEDPTKTPGTVGMVLKSGYTLNGRCLRAAQVGTIKAPAKTA